jgi:hypothetical protein
MSVIIQGFQLRTAQFGQQVIKGPSTLPAGTTATLATVAGGAILITSCLGLITTVMSGTATTLALGTAPTIGSANTGGIAAAGTVTSLQAGVWAVPVVNAGAAGTLTVGATAGAAPYLPTPFVVTSGLITWTTTGTNTGAMKWYFTYVALDIGASLS